MTGPRLVRTAAGIAAAASGEWAAAEGHFVVAQRQAEDMPMRLEQVDLLRFRAMMMLSRGSAGDLATARSLLGDAAEQYARFAMPRHRDLTERLLTTSAA